MPPRSFHRTAAIFGVLRDRELRALWFADWISDAGNFVTFIALAVYVNKLTGSALAVGIALALRSVPWFTIGPFGGVLADRLDRRRLMIGSNLIRAGLVAALPFTHAAWQAYAIALASSSFGPVFRPARGAMLAQIAAGERLVPALVVAETTHSVLHTLGPAFGGLMVLALGARNAFFVDAASFVLAAAFIVTIPSRGRPPPSEHPVLEEIRDGVRAIVRAPAVRTYSVMNAGMYFGGAGVTALLVVYVRDVLHQPGGEFGLVLSVAGLGTVLASLAIGARDDHHPRTPWTYLAVIGMAAFCLAAFTPALAFLLPIAFVSGLTDAGTGIPMSATIAEALPDAVRGRVYGAVQGLDEFAAASGSVLFAWLGEPGRLGIPGGLALAAGVGAGLGLAVLVFGGAEHIRRFERERLTALAARSA